MTEEADNIIIQKRFRRNAFITLAILTVISLIWANRGIVFGVLLGGALSFLNWNWLSGSIAAILKIAGEEQSGKVPAWTASKFILRYLIIGSIIIIAVNSGYCNPLGIGIGFASVVGGVMIEAFYQIYLFFKSEKET